MSDDLKERLRENYSQHMRDFQSGEVIETYENEREEAADRIAALEAEVERLRAWSLKAYTVVEWAVGEGFVLEPPHYDADDLLLEGVDLLGVVTPEEARAALKGE